MLRSPWEWVLLALIIGGPLAMLRRGRNGDRVFLLSWLHLIYGSLYVLLAPEGGTSAATIAVFGLIAIDLVLRASVLSPSRPVPAWIRSPRILVVMTLVSMTLMPLAGTEILCRILTSRGILRYHQPIETVWRAGHDDWRVATITADIHREPDPVLLWRPAASRPYNSQRFKGPVIQVPKPEGVVRIFCYGDSLTDGPPRGDWPGRLHRLLNEHPHRPDVRFEVINAGVAGYSSHQGLLRFLQEVDHYQPDLILTSFGWNDAAQATGPPDSQFVPPAQPIVALQRALIRYRSYLVLTAYLKQLIAAPPPDRSLEYHPRVSIPEYLTNLDQFRTEAQKRQIPIVFLTRPHELPATSMREHPTWRRHVPEYNQAMLLWAVEKHARLIDTQAFFEQQPRELFSDECHFFPPGHEKMAELLRDRLLNAPDRFFKLAENQAALVATPSRGDQARKRPVEKTASSHQP